MKILGKAGCDGIAHVYLAELRPGMYTEFVESVQPPIPWQKKWVLIVSTLFGCPIGCAMCDAGGEYKGRLTTEEILAQIDFLVTSRFPDRKVPVENFKIQFARVGEPSLNPNLLDVLERLPRDFNAPGLVPSISTIAPLGNESFFNRLCEIKNKYYSNGKFQMQFSVHSSDEKVRDKIIPAKKWDFEAISAYGKRFYMPGDKKISLNFALAADSPLEPNVLLKHFSPEIFLVKLTPVNPTMRAHENGINGFIRPECPGSSKKLKQRLEEAGYDVILSIGETEENKIGSNCGQYIRTFLEHQKPTQGGYEYKVAPQETEL